MREYEEMKRQMEEDSDREILTLKTTYERKLQDEKVALHVRLTPWFSKTFFLSTIIFGLIWNWSIVAAAAAVVVVVVALGLVGTCLLVCSTIGGYRHLRSDLLKVDS